MLDDYYYRTSTAAHDDFKDKDGCCVITWSVLFRAPYTKSNDYLETKGRVWRRGMKLHQIEDAFEGVEKSKIAKGPYTNKNRITVSKFLQKHPEGRFFCVSKGHAFAIIDGKVYDYKKGPRRQIVAAWRVYLPEKG